MTAEQLQRGEELRGDIWNIQHKINAITNLTAIYITGTSGNHSMGESIQLNQDSQDSKAATKFVSEYRVFLENELQKLNEEFKKL